MSKIAFQLLGFVINNFGIRPRAIILNPPLQTIKARLDKRRDKATRKNRDKVFEEEDADIFLKNLHNYFKKFKSENSVLYIEDNSDLEIKKIVAWARGLPLI